MNKERLLKLVDFLETLPEEKFYFGRYVLRKDKNSCGTVCCAVGWMPKVFGEESPVRWGKFGEAELDACSGNKPFDKQVEDFFDIRGEDYDYLFLPKYSGLGKDATPKEVAQRIRNFANGIQPN